MKFIDLPYPLFLEIVLYLSASDAIRCRRLSKGIYQALTGQDLSISLILGHFPRSLEGRLLRQRGRIGDGDTVDWAAVFARLTRRYLHLHSARPHRTLKIETLKDPALLRGVTPWNRFLRLDKKTAPFHYWDPVWTFSPRDGLLVYPAPDGLGYQARDVATGEQVAVPFELEGKVVRRVRLNDGVLVLEWCEEEAAHAINEQESAHRHFATAYDVRRSSGWDGVFPPLNAAPPLSLWTFRFRAEWKIHYLGLPLSAHDRFFSAHNATHYVIYVWQPTRSPWGEDAPLERLIVWELGEPSNYRPSLDPGGQSPPSGPRVIRRLANQQLDTWGVRQGDTPSLRGIYLDGSTWDGGAEAACGHVFFHEEDHRWTTGPHGGPSTSLLHQVKCTGIPLQGDGPRWMHECGSGPGGVLACWRGPQHPEVRRYGDDAAWPGRAPCWRHDDFPYLTVSEASDYAAGVRITARQCFLLETLSVHVRPRMRVAGAHWGAGKAKFEGPAGREAQFGDDWWGEMLGKGFMCGNERWIVGEDQRGDVTVMIF